MKFTAADTLDMFEMLDKNEADIMLTLDNHIHRNDYVIAKEKHIDMHFVTKEKVKDGKLAYLNMTDIQTDIWEQLIYHKNKWVSNCLKVFIEFVTEVEF